MNGWEWTAIALVIFGLPAALIFGAYAGQTDTMKEAFERGYAVQCVGKSAYYWECEK